MSYSIIIPNFNSSSFITKKINKLISFLKKTKINYEIIIVDDCSNDNSFIKIKELVNKNKKIRVIKNKINTGKSYSLIRGISKSKYKKIILIDSDLPYFYRLKNILDDLKIFDLVMIDRKHNVSKNLDTSFSYYQFFRVIIGLLFNKIIRIFLSINYRDTQAGLKGFIKPYNFSRINFVSKRFFFDVELILFFLKKKKKIKTIPVNFRVSNNSTIKIFALKKNIEIIKELFKIIIK